MNSNNGAKCTSISPMPLIDGLPADYRRPDDVATNMTIHMPERVKKAFNDMKAECGGIPSWVALVILFDAYTRLKAMETILDQK